MKIFTLAYNRPDFIEKQYNSLKKWVKDFEYIVFDNSLYDDVESECERLGIECVPIKIYNSDPSWCVGLSLNEIWKVLDKKGQAIYIDSDMFLIGELPNITGYDIAYVPQVRGDIVYPWTGLMMFNFDTLPHPEKMQWQVDYSIKADVGGLNHFYLKDYKPKVLELEMWTLMDKDEYSHNGVDVKSDAPQFKTMENLFKDFPRPYTVDLFQVKGRPFRECFIFHYKFSSNYAKHNTKEYNKLKTIALNKFLCDK